MSDLQSVSYSHAGVNLTGWLARPKGTPRAAVLVFPTIANHNEGTAHRAQMLAELGYLAIVADFYGEPVASFEASFPLAKALREDNAYYRARCAAAISALRGLPEARGLTVFAIGYCMGGQAALETARDGQDLAAVVSFHGTLGASVPTAPGAIKARILVCHGDADPMVPRDQVMGFWEEMDAAGANWHFHAYSGVKHGFTEPASDSRGMDALGYDASADRQSWAAMVNLFDEILG
ncbi:dienelactone hydrolase family protein [Novosphingobium pentaromativorans]|uniref:Dienelactone hydrolase n=1 Tax=Novosphingobium pentaromativorans US6-1 TaxID=1088721 RepID=G6EJ63_9SPHN|nr:dienelactone hydrolase family protein [Novosphingobium pentaromativorans]AIT79021.1 dienelactone hydrolase [Novosphingobium pentaromativorans US6-1]EHJ58649.1 dienelactone hydrolase [Novosphingobium pentaromativorans US6-1]